MAQRHASQHISNINKRKNRDAAIIRLAAIVKYSGDAIIGKTLQGVITSWNNSAEKLFGYAADEVIGKSLSLIFPPDRQEELPQILARIKLGEIVQHFETTRMRKDGTYVEVSVTVSPIRDPDGRIIAASTIVHNITEQKRMIEELATRSRELEHSNEELATRSRELEHSNEELATRSRELEHSNEELATRSRELEHSNEELATRSRELERSNEELATRSRELEHSNEELATRSRELEGSVEELATRSRELERSNEELATRSRELERSNEELATRSRELERSNEELATRSRELEGSVEELATRSRELERSNEELATRSRELERSNEDLSRQRDELATLNSDLEEANQARSQFLSTMSHELRTPLASIIGFSQMLLDDADIVNLNPQQHNDLERILKNGQHLLSLINEVLDLTKIEAGRMVVTYSQVDVRELLTSVVEETQSIAIANHLVLRVEVDERVAFLESNPLKLRQVLLNLVSNALKFTEQGEVMVSARRVISSGKEADQIAIAVKDSGIGIHVDVQEHIFEAFYQVDGSYTRKIGGTGLGLSIVSQLTTLLGGTIAVTSAPGQGSTFTVLLPVKALHQYIEQASPSLHVAQPQTAPMIPPSSGDLPPAIIDQGVAAAAQRGATDGTNTLILAVDDNPDVTILITAALKDTPYTVVGLQDSLKAMELVQELHPCAIILDVMMPNVNGWQLLNQLKVNPATAAIPVMIITMLTEPSSDYVLGADAYLFKPFKSTVLLNTLQHLLASQQDHSQAGEREAQQV